jgi:hypothetical protein
MSRRCFAVDLAATMKGRVRRLAGRAVLATFVAVSLVAASAGPAAAAVPGLVLVEVVGSDFAPEVVAKCPERKDLVGAGFYIRVGSWVAHRPTLTVSFARPLVAPGAVRDSIVIRAEKTTTSDGSWRVAALALCADPPPGLEVVSRSTLPGSDPTRGIVASCPKGKQLVGTGFEVSNGRGQVIVEDVIPDGDAKTAPTSVEVRAFEKDFLSNGDYPDDWALTAQAVCADPLPGLVRVSASTMWSTDASQDIVASCSAGQVVVGTGFEVHGALGRVIVQAVGPLAKSETDLPTEVMVNAMAPEPFGMWYVDAYAICADA